MAKKKAIPTREGVYRDARFSLPDVKSQPISWRFSLMDTEGPFAFAKLKPSTWGRILARMKEWESMTWAELMGERNHEIPVERLSGAALRRLEELKLDDIDAVCSIHMDGKSRFFGIRFENVFHVLWWDPEHQVCPSNMKHT